MIITTDSDPRNTGISQPSGIYDPLPASCCISLPASLEGRDGQQSTRPGQFRFSYDQASVVVSSANLPAASPPMAHGAAAAEPIAPPRQTYAFRRPRHRSPGPSRRPCSSYISPGHFIGRRLGSRTIRKVSVAADRRPVLPRTMGIASFVRPPLITAKIDTPNTMTANALRLTLSFIPTFLDLRTYTHHGMGARGHTVFMMDVV